MTDEQDIQNSRLKKSAFAVGDIVRRKKGSKERCVIESLSVSKGQLVGLGLTNVKADNSRDKRFGCGFSSNVESWELEFRPEITLANRAEHSLFWDLQAAKFLDPDLLRWYADGWHLMIALRAKV